MKNVLLKAFGLAFLCSGAVAFADEEKPAETQPERPRLNREEFLQKYDKNKDGTIDEEERAAARADFERNRPEGERGRGPGRPGEGRPGENRGPGFGFNREEIMKQYDKDGNGELSESEREAMMAAFQKQREEREAEFKKTFDKDGDGSLNADEEAAYNKAVEERRSRFGNRGPGQQGRPGEGRGPGQFGQGFNREEMLKQYDKDGNGELDEKEREAMMAAFQKQREEREAEFKKTFDKDGDGKLNAEEEAAYTKAAEERRSRFGNRNRGEGRDGRPGREQRPQRPDNN